MGSAGSGAAASSAPPPSGGLKECGSSPGRYRATASAWLRLHKGLLLAVHPATGRRARQPACNSLSPQGALHDTVLQSHQIHNLLLTDFAVVHETSKFLGGVILTCAWKHNRERRALGAPQDTGSRGGRGWPAPSSMSNAFNNGWDAACQHAQQSGRHRAVVCNNPSSNSCQECNA